MKGFETANMNEVSKKLRHFIKHGKPQGLTTGIKPLDEFYKPIKGGCTDITGYPYSGKTLLASEIMLGMSQQHGWKQLLYMPDSGTETDIYAHIIQKLTTKSFDKSYPNLISEEELLDGVLEWVGQHFTVLKKVDFGVRMKPEEFWKYAIDEGYDNAVIDSWNFMDVGEGTKELGRILSFRNEIAESKNLHCTTIIHPRNPTTNDYTKEGILKAPGVFNLMGGSEWNNNGKNIIVIHKEEKESDIYDVYIRKTKPREVGKTGQIMLKFDIPSQRFYTPNMQTAEKDYNIKNTFSKQTNTAIKLVENYNSPNKGALAGARVEDEWFDKNGNEKAF